MNSILTKINSKVSRYFFNAIVNCVAGSLVTPPTLRYLALRFFNIDTKTKNIEGMCFFGGKNITIGEGSFINIGCFFDNNDKITIGNNCEIAMNVLFCTSSHKTDNNLRRSGILVSGPIEIKDGTWIGANVTILPGVIIGEGCVIAAGAVVTKDCEPNGVYAGVPAIRIKDL